MRETGEAGQANHVPVVIRQLLNRGVDSTQRLPRLRFDAGRSPDRHVNGSRPPLSSRITALCAPMTSPIDNLAFRRPEQPVSERRIGSVLEVRRQEFGTDRLDEIRRGLARSDPSTAPGLDERAKGREVGSQSVAEFGWVQHSRVSRGTRVRILSFPDSSPLPDSPSRRRSAPRSTRNPSYRACPDSSNCR